MGTSSRIGKLLPDGKVKCITCHYDGYVSGGVGEDLLNCYEDETKIDALLELGNLSGIGKVIGEKQDFYDFHSQNPDWCLAYGRDRGEKGMEAKTIPLAEFQSDKNWCYLYLFKDGEWWFYDTNQDRYSDWQTISSALNIKEDEDEDQ